MAVTGSFTAAAQVSAIFTPKPGLAAPEKFNLSISGTFVGTLALERSFDGGATWLLVENNSGAIEKLFDEVEIGALYRLRMSAWTSGTAVYRLSN